MIPHANNQTFGHPTSGPATYVHAPSARRTRSTPNDRETFQGTNDPCPALGGTKRSQSAQVVRKSVGPMATTLRPTPTARAAAAPAATRRPSRSPAKRSGHTAYTFTIAIAASSAPRALGSRSASPNASQRNASTLPSPTARQPPGSSISTTAATSTAAIPRLPDILASSAA